MRTCRATGLPLKIAASRPSTLTPERARWRVVGEEDYSVERQLLATRVFPTEQGRLDPAPHTPASVVDPGEVYRRWRSSQGSGLDGAEVELVFGLFTDEVQGPHGGPLLYEHRPAWVVFDTYTTDDRPGHRPPRFRTQPATPFRYRISEASVYDAQTGEYLTGCRLGTPLA